MGGFIYETIFLSLSGALTPRLLQDAYLRVLLLHCMDFQSWRLKSRGLRPMSSLIPVLARWARFSRDYPESDSHTEIFRLISYFRLLYTLGLNFREIPVSSFSSYV